MSELNTQVTLLTEPPFLKEVKEGEYVIVVGVPANLYTRAEIRHAQVAFAGRQEFVSFAAGGLPKCVKAVLTTESCASHLAHDDTIHARVRIHVLNNPQQIRTALSETIFPDNQNFASTLDGGQVLATEDTRPKLKEKIKAEEAKPEPAPQPASNAQPALFLKQPPTRPQPKTPVPTFEQLRHAAAETRDDFWGKPNPCTIGGVDFDNRPHAARALIFLYRNFTAEQIRDVVSELGTPQGLTCEVYNTARQKLARYGGHQGHASPGAGNGSNHHNDSGPLTVEEENKILKRLLLLTTSTLDTVEQELKRFRLKD